MLDLQPLLALTPAGSPLWLRQGLVAPDGLPIKPLVPLAPWEALCGRFALCADGSLVEVYSEAQQHQWAWFLAHRRNVYRSQFGATALANLDMIDILSRIAAGEPTLQAWAQGLLDSLANPPQGRFWIGRLMGYQEGELGRFRDGALVWGYDEEPIKEGLLVVYEAGDLTRPQQAFWRSEIEPRYVQELYCLP